MGVKRGLHSDCIKYTLQQSVFADRTSYTNYHALVLTISLSAFNVKGGIISAPEYHGESSPKLQIITATKEKIEAECSKLTDDGILIVSGVSPRGEAVRVSIKSTSGETIFEVSHLFGDFNL